MVTSKHWGIWTLAVLLPTQAWGQVDCGRTFGASAEPFPIEWAACLPASSVPIDVDAATDTAFVNNLFAPGSPPNPPLGIHGHVLNAFPGSLTFRGPTNPAILGLDFDAAANTLFAVVSSTAATLPPPNNRTIGTIDQTTGAYTPIANLTGWVNQASELAADLVINPVSDETYLISNEGTTAGNITTRLYRVNRSTGALTLLGTATAQPSFLIDAAINCEGQMYGHQFTSPTTPSRLVSIDTGNGAISVIGPTGFPANFAQGMDFDADTGVLYMWHFFATAVADVTLRYGTVNLSTGALTPIFSSTPGAGVQLEGGAVRSQCPAAEADLSITKTAQVPANLGLNQNFTYTLTVRNNGPGNASGVVVTDPLPSGHVYVGNNCGATFASNTLTWTIGNLANGATQSCVITVRASQFGLLRNTASVIASGTDPVPANNSATITIAGAVLAAPTLSASGLVLLALALLGGAAVVSLRRPA